MKVSVCSPPQSLPTPHGGEEHQLLHKTDRRLTRQSQLYSKLGLPGEQAGEATAGPKQTEWDVWTQWGWDTELC